MQKEIRVRVTPGSRRERFVERKPGVFEASIREEARQGDANTRLVALAALHFGVPRRSVRILAGAHSRGKRLRIDLG